ncbi:cyclin-like protein [Phanerochaete sordida]|uniref:Cyclin-like protein n=1 Tax=Phanerochaete sordida TaxID=48140 RepID=A0A9P3L6E0_9APHY|nr:cyclin-like protein [Phanerochaete sordida]
MATDFWASSQYKRWIVDRATLKRARAEDLYYAGDPEVLDLFNIFFANVISKLGKKLGFRQRVTATATVFFRRFYLKNSYCETDPFMVIAACCYVAAKAEESPVHIKNVVTEARLLFGGEEYGGIKSFPSDNSKLAEMEFYLVDDLECDLVVFHPYRTLLALCGKESASSAAVAAAVVEAEAGELGTGVDDGPRYWGTGEGKLELQETALQTAWLIINDTFRSDLCLLYPPHMIGIAAIYLTLVFHAPTYTSIRSQSQGASNSQPPSQPQSAQSTPSNPRRSSRSSSSQPKKPSQDVVGFMAGLNVNMEVIASIAQEIISLYTLWDRYNEDGHDGSARTAISAHTSARGTKRAAGGIARSGSVASGGTTTSRSGTPDSHVPAVVTPQYLTKLLIQMREAKMRDMAHPESGRPQAYDKRLGRTQNA